MRGDRSEDAVDVEVIANRHRFHSLFQQAFQSHKRLAQIGANAAPFEAGVDDSTEESAEYRIADAARDARGRAALLKTEIDPARRRKCAFEAEECAGHEARDFERLSPPAFAGVEAD